MMKKGNQSRMRQHYVSGTVASLATVSVLLLSSSVVPSESGFTDSSTANVSVSADKLAPPTSIKVTNARVGETDVSWTASASTYVTGYKIYRSSVIAGPWVLLGSTTGRTSVNYVDKTSGAKSYFYKIEAIYNNWVTPAISFVAPPAVGRSFYDGFEGTPGNLDNRRTEDGSSNWLVWSGEMSTADSNPRDLPGVPHDFAAYGTPDANPSPGNGDVAVVRTPVNDAWVFATDFDGLERFILRGKDPNNYIHVGGAGGVGTFEIVEVRNGIETILATKHTVDSNKNFRVEIRGNTINAYVDAVKGDPTSGTLHLSVNSSFQQTDPSATYFGIGFTRGGYGINDFTFQAF